ncbi:TnsA-like heteromeric transposase endonuclease subunit [Streptomyces sp. SID13031]|nr:TnsA-like heteromeric transposase endonuclease subunit [Streptomyces sp. SID13031]
MGFVDAEGVERQELLADVAGLRFETGLPVRSFPSYRGQRNWPGWWWSATTGALVGYESWLERDHAMALDFDEDVVAFASQPFWLLMQVDGKQRSHAPDYFARHRDGSAMVLDCRPDDRIGPRDAAVFGQTARVCEQVGWSYRRVGALPAVAAANIRWLSGYRHGRFGDAGMADRLRDVFVKPLELAAGASRCGLPLAVLPVLFHLLWRHELHTDLSVALSEVSLVEAR